MEILITFCVNSLEITIGFEQTTYSFSEPSFSTSSQMICIQLRSGTLSSDLLIQPDWNQDTAIGNVTFLVPVPYLMHCMTIISLQLV